jgi:hypothetical protein
MYHEMSATRRFPDGGDIKFLHMELFCGDASEHPAQVGCEQEIALGCAISDRLPPLPLRQLHNGSGENLAGKRDSDPHQ